MINYARLLNTKLNICFSYSRQYKQVFINAIREMPLSWKMRWKFVWSDQGKGQLMQQEIKDLATDLSTTLSEFEVSP